MLFLWKLPECGKKCPSICLVVPSHVYQGLDPSVSPQCLLSSRTQSYSSLKTKFDFANNTKLPVIWDADREKLKWTEFRYIFVQSKKYPFQEV